MIKGSFINLLYIIYRNKNPGIYLPRFLHMFNWFGLFYASDRDRSNLFLDLLPLSDQSDLGVRT